MSGEFTCVGHAGSAASAGRDPATSQITLASSIPSFMPWWSPASQGAAVPVPRRRHAAHAAVAVRLPVRPDGGLQGLKHPTMDVAQHDAQRPVHHGAAVRVRPA